MAQNIGEIRALTGIRGLAALWVVIYHVHIEDAVPVPFNIFLHHGYLAVDLFFVLSGFILALSYERFFESGWNARNYGLFLIRRIARIYPLYLAITTIIALSIWLGASHALPREDLFWLYPLNLTLTQAWHFGPSIDGHAWSISTEFAAYLLFPLLTSLMIGARPLIAGLMGLGCFLIVFYIGLLPTPPEATFPRQGPLDAVWPGTIWPLLRCLAEFCLGLGTYRFMHSARLHATMAKIWVGDALTLGLIALAFIPGSDVAIVALLPALVLALAVGKGWMARLCSVPAIFFLGEISYAIYLLHSQFLRMRWIGPPILERFLPYHAAEIGSLILLYGAVIVSAWLAYRFLERPARRFLRRAEVWITP